MPSKSPRKSAAPSRLEWVGRVKVPSDHLIVMDGADAPAWTGNRPPSAGEQLLIFWGSWQEKLPAPYDRGHVVAAGTADAVKQLAGLTSAMGQPAADPAALHKQ